MWGLIRRSILIRPATTNLLNSALLPPAGRGRLELDRARCTACGQCAAVCPTGALVQQSASTGWVVDAAGCIRCGRCADICPEHAIHHSKVSDPPTTDHSELYYDPAHAATPWDILNEINRIMGRSLHVRHVDCGSCNGCDWEMTALNNPVYDLQRLGIDFVASPRHADALMVTGPVTRNLELALARTLEATPHPRVVIAVGGCACGGGMFGGTYASHRGVDTVVPVDVFIPGCPPRPPALMYGLLLATQVLRSRWEST